MNILEAVNLSKIYTLGEHEVRALNSVDFVVETGEFVSIMGPSGSGKSTLMHLLGGLDSATKGDVILSGQKLSGLNTKQITLARRKHVGFVFQFFNLLPTLTAEENIMLPIVIDGKNPKKYEERLTRLLNLIGLEPRRQHRPDQLSGGEQQRVAIARALISEPAILLADEPTGNLDSKTGQEIMGLLRRSCEELQQTVVVVSHDPRASAYADRVVFLKDGDISTHVVFTDEADVDEKLDVLLEKMRELGF